MPWRRAAYALVAVTLLGAVASVSATAQPSTPVFAGGSIGFVHPSGNTCGLVAPGPGGITGELQTRPVVRGAWWEARVDGGATYFADSPGDAFMECDPRTRPNPDDDRTLAGFANLGATIVISREHSTMPFTPYARLSPGFFVGRLRDGNIDQRLLAAGVVLREGIGVRIGTGPTRFTVELHGQSLARVFGLQIHTIGMTLGVTSIP